ncbi:hypothetical protein NQ315_016703, partial [Exocentrus adspersus]
MTQSNDFINLFCGPVIWRFGFNLNSLSNIQTIETKHANSLEFYLLLANSYLAWEVFKLTPCIMVNTNVTAMWAAPISGAANRLSSS